MSAPSSPPSSKLEAASPVEQLASDSHYAATLGKYRVLGALGRGGMAEVYLAIADGPEGFRKLCVLKLLREDLHDDVDFRTMFLDEARLAARLTHPHIVQTFEVDESEGRLLIAMEFVDGQPLTRVLRHVSLERFPLEASVRVLCDVLDALEYAHELTDFDGSKLGIVPCGNADFRDTQAALEAEIAQNGVPDAILAGNDQMGIAAMKLIAARGLAVPGDVGITGFNAFEFWQYTEPVLTTIRSAAYEMGALGGEVLLERLTAGRFDRREIVFPVELQRGGST